MLIVAIVVAIVGGAIGYAVKPTPPEIAELQDRISELETTVSTQESKISGLESQIAKAQIGKGYHIVLVTGDEADAFTTSIVKGAEDAAAQFGNALDVLYSKGWAGEEFIANLRTAIALNPDGIIYESFGDPATVADEIDTAYDQGIIVTLMNFDIPDVSKRYIECGTIAPDPHTFGYGLAEHAVEEFGLGPGDRCAVIGGFWTDPIFMNRTKGIADGLVEEGCTVDKVVLPVEVFGDPSIGLAYITGYVADHPDVKFIAFDGAGTTAVTTWYMEQMGKAPGEIHVAGFDPTPGALTCIKEGYLDFVMDQQQYVYGYLTTLNLILTMEYGFMGFTIDTTGGYVDKTNVDLIEALSAQHIR